MELPRFVVLKSEMNGKYLCYCKKNGGQENSGLFQFSGKNVVSPYVKFEVELANSSNEKHPLVHIKCCYNKYWVIKLFDDQQLIVAGASKPEENKSKSSCTLFEPVYVDDMPNPKRVRFFHVQLKKYVCLWGNAPSNYDSCLKVGSATPEKDKSDVCTIMDWQSLLILPKHIALKGDNDLYLSARWIEGHPYLQFACSDIGDATVGNKVSTNGDGSISIWSNTHQKFWRRSPNWIWADSNAPSSDDLDTLFHAVKVDDNVIALRNLGNNNFCSRLTTEGKENCLNAAVNTITREARLKVEELVISRTIYNMDFHLADANVHDEKPITMATGESENTSEQTNSFVLKLAYVETRTSTWSSSVSLKLGAKTTIEVSCIPLIVNGKIEISAEFSGAYQWGETQTWTSTVETAYTAVVPPMTKVKVRLLATKGTCSVPFRYTQRDNILTDGEAVIESMEDGVYSGINYFNFKFETEHQPLHGSKTSAAF
ncbi:uncharacterized protein LOC127794271 [Diospyros lotus]|uniref:uncharacterized protein LOC127794271 n=1 Tax=Diospyros lotus TaxID=55363 RepID=UPI0022539D47|nr:uncharacterized protein LOC127794271 [Diospyros lotus]